MFAFAKKKLDGKKKKNPDDPSQAQTHRLAKPELEHCVLCFKPSLADLTFEGSIILKMSVKDATSAITLHAVELIITKAIWEEDGTLNRQEPSEIPMDQDKGTLSLVFSPSLLEQSGQLRLNFKGNMSDKRLAGFYVYNTIPVVHMEEEVQPNGTIAYIAQKKPQLNLISEFEPCESRRCFPFWDDPAVKTTFDLIVVVPKGSVVLGPTPIKAVYPHRRDKSLEVVEFKTTPKLCSHALGFAYGSFDFIEQKTAEDELLIRVFAPPGKSADGEFALNLACRAFPFFQEFFGVPLNQQKLDLVAIPDYIVEPIECWGLIFYRSSDILVEPDTAAIDILSISLKMCHEIVKQWFGNLVTHEWWSYQWIKEGFSTYAKYLFVDQMFPEMEVWHHFVTHHQSKALFADGHKFSHPMEVDVITSQEIEESLDDVCRVKSACLLRMTENILGTEVFRDGLKLFLETYSNGNATSTDFWKCLQQVSSKPIVSMMSTWCNHRGYPLLIVTQRHDGKVKTMRISQERFYYDQTHKDTKNTSPVFIIPVSVSTRSSPDVPVVNKVMDGRATTIVLHNVDKTDWVKINPGFVGFYRVKYPLEMYSSLVYAIREKSLPAMDRLNVLDDTFAFLLAGYFTTIETLSLVEAFVEDDDFSVWSTISTLFIRFIRVFEHVGKHESFKSYGRYIYGQVYRRVGWIDLEEEPIQTKFLRSLVLKMMGTFEHPAVVERCKALYDGQFGDEPVPLPVTLKPVVYRSVVSNGDDSIIKRFFRLYRDSDSADERDKIAYALGSVRVKEQIQHVLELSISDEVRRAHTVFMFTSLSKTKLGREMAWQFFKDNFAIFKSKFGPHQASQILQAILHDFATDEKGVDIQDFFRANPYPGTEWVVQQVIESIRLNEVWLRREKNLAALQDYLESMQDAF